MGVAGEDMLEEFRCVYIDAGEMIVGFVGDIACHKGPALEGSAEPHCIGVRLEVKYQEGQDVRLSSRSIVVCRILAIKEKGG
jgi:hypothetical protein